MFKSNPEAFAHKIGSERRYRLGGLRRLRGQLGLKCDTSHTGEDLRVLRSTRISSPQPILRLAGSFVTLMDGFQPPNEVSCSPRLIAEGKILKLYYSYNSFEGMIPRKCTCSGSSSFDSNRREGRRKESRGSTSAPDPPPYGSHGQRRPGVHGIFQARILEWVAMPSSRGSSQPRDRTRVSRIVGRRFTL